MSHEYGLSERDMGIESKDNMNANLEQLKGLQEAIAGNFEELLDKSTEDDRRSQVLNGLESKIEQNYQQMLRLLEIVKQHE